MKMIRPVRMLQKINCIICGQQFLRDWPRQVCCSDQCKERRRRDVRRLAGRRKERRYKEKHGISLAVARARRHKEDHGITLTAARAQRSPGKGPFTCRKCGKEYYRRPKGYAGGGKTYCSRECAFADTAAWNPKRETEPAFTALAVCTGCNSTLINPRRKFCSDCRQTIEDLRPWRACSHCGELFRAVRHGQRICSSACATDARAEARKKGRQKRGSGRNRARARYYGVPYQYINTIKVFERDGWRCQICGVSTPKSRRGTKHFNAPELDHRVPLSKGGGHVYENVQCACRRCNTQKGNATEVGQMPMFGWRDLTTSNSMRITDG